MTHVKHEKRLMDINTKDIIVDTLGQRDVENRQKEFKNMVDDFYPDLPEPVDLSFVNGKYYCYDGQMRIKVYKFLNDGKDLTIPAMVIFGLTLKETADLFIMKNDPTTHISTKLYERIIVMANYGDQESLDFVRTVERNGFRIDKAKEDTDNNLVRIQATKALWDEYEACENLSDFDNFLHVLYNGFLNDPMQTNNKIIKGLGLFMRTYKGMFDMNTLIKSLSKVRISDIIRDAEADKSTGSRKYAVRILGIYNHGLHKQNKLQNIL